MRVAAEKGIDLPAVFLCLNAARAVYEVTAGSKEGKRAVEKARLQRDNSLEGDGSGSGEARLCVGAAAQHACVGAGCVEDDGVIGGGQPLLTEFFGCERGGIVGDAVDAAIIPNCGVCLHPFKAGSGKIDHDNGGRGHG